MVQSCSCGHDHWLKGPWGTSVLASFTWNPTIHKKNNGYKIWSRRFISSQIWSCYAPKHFQPSEDDFAMREIGIVDGNSLEAAKEAKGKVNRGKEWAWMKKGFMRRKKRNLMLNKWQGKKKRVKKADSGVTTASKLMRAKRDWKWALLIWKALILQSANTLP